MESTGKSTPESGKPAPELQDSTVLETPAASYSNRNKFNLVLADFTLRILLFASTITAVLVMVTSKQTELVPILTVLLPAPAKFNYSPAFIYFVVALSVTCLYSIITTLASLMAIWKPFPSDKLLVHFALLDVLMLGLVASATGAAGGVAYIGLRGNSHVQWAKICNLYDKFCRHVGGSIAVSLFASFLLVLLLMISIFSLYRRTH